MAAQFQSWHWQNLGFNVSFVVAQVNTEAIAGEGLILTAGGIDTHIHYICPQQADEAIASGKTLHAFFYNALA